MDLLDCVIDFGAKKWGYKYVHAALKRDHVRLDTVAALPSKVKQAQHRKEVQAMTTQAAEGEKVVQSYLKKLSLIKTIALLLA